MSEMGLREGASLDQLFSDSLVEATVKFTLYKWNLDGKKKKKKIQMCSVLACQIRSGARYLTDIALETSQQPKQKVCSV